MLDYGLICFIKKKYEISPLLCYQRLKQFNLKIFYNWFSTAYNFYANQIHWIYLISPKSETLHSKSIQIDLQNIILDIWYVNL